MKNAPLKIEVAHGELRIRIGVSTLAHAFHHSAENNPYDEDQKVTYRMYKVTSVFDFARDIARVLQEEAEDGATAVTELLDEVCQTAVGDGSTAVSPVDVFEGPAQ